MWRISGRASHLLALLLVLWALCADVHPVVFARNSSSAIPLQDGRFRYRHFNCSVNPSAVASTNFSIQVSSALGRSGPYPVRVQFSYTDNSTYCAAKNKVSCLQNFGDLTVQLTSSRNASYPLQQFVYPPNDGTLYTFTFNAVIKEEYIVTVFFPCSNPDAFPQYPFVYGVSAIWQDGARAWVVALLTFASILIAILVVLLGVYIYRKHFRRRFFSPENYLPIADEED